MVDEPTIARLRRFRDEVLLETTSGRQLVVTYECVGPGLTTRCDALPQPVRWCIAKNLDLAAWAIEKALLQ